MKKIMLFMVLPIFVLMFLTGCGTGTETHYLWKLNYKDEIVFGNYQGNPITWIVLDDIDAPEDTILLISKEILDVKQMNDVEKKVTWEDSTLNEWLNTEFINEVFDKNIIDNIVINSENGETNKITVLSSLQYELNLPTDENRIASGTSYAYNQGLEGSDWYWTKTPCKKDEKAYEAVYGDEGWIRTGGLNVTSKNVGVRPAFWIKKDTNIKQ